MKENIAIAGGDTAQPLNTQKRVSIVAESSRAFDQPRLLDCGCGAGSYLPYFESIGWDVMGIEFLPEKVEEARNAGLGEDKLIQGDLQSMPFASSSFDILFFNEVLEHVPSDQAALSEAHRVLKDDGLVVIFSPNRLYPFESHGVYLKKKEKVKLPVWTPFIPYIPTRLGTCFFEYWARNYWPGQLRRMVKASGFSIVETSFVWQTFEGISGSKTGWLNKSRPLLRSFSTRLEKTPLLNVFGISQYICAKKEPSTPEQTTAQKDQ